MVLRRGEGFGSLLRLVAVLLVVAFGYWLFSDGGPDPKLRIVSGSENKALQPIIEAWGRDNDVDVEIDYLGSVDIARGLERGEAFEYDAVWPAASLWIAFGDTRKVVKHEQSILRSPVVLGLRRSIAEDLGWIGRDDVAIAEIQAAAEAGRFRLAMTSATQSNSGASAYLGFLHAAAGAPDALTEAMLDQPSVQARVRGLLGAVDRSSGSSGWLAEAFVANPDRFDAMINYEALIIESNRKLLQAGREPLYAIYPADGLAVADSPLAYVRRGEASGRSEAERAATQEAFLALQKHLLSPDVQDLLISYGRRAGLLGLDVSRANPRIWNRDWGIDLDRAVAPIPTPREGVVRKALALYQTALRKPSLTIWALDVSGSMEGEPIAALKEAMRLLLDPELAERHLLQPSDRDLTAVIPFNHEPLDVWVVEGAGATALQGLLRKVEGLEAGGKTDLYQALRRAVDLLQNFERRGVLEGRLPAVVAMTDGKSDTGRRRAFLAALRRASFAEDLPIHAIAFGEADEGQLQELTQATVGRLFKAKGDLAAALRKAKGYN